MGGWGSVDSELFVFSAALQSNRRIPKYRLGAMRGVRITGRLRTLNISIVRTKFPVSDPNSFGSIVRVSGTIA